MSVLFPTIITIIQTQGCFVGFIKIIIIINIIIISIISIIFIIIITWSCVRSRSHARPTCAGQRKTATLF